MKLLFLILIFFGSVAFPARLRKAGTRALQCRQVLLDFIELKSRDQLSDVFRIISELQITYHESPDWKDPAKVKHLEEVELPRPVIDPNNGRREDAEQSYSEFFLFKCFPRETQLEIAKVLQYSKMRTMQVLKELAENTPSDDAEFVEKLALLNHYLFRWTHARNLLHTTNRRLIFWRKMTRSYPPNALYDRNDLISDLDGVLANSAELFNPEKGFSFPAYVLPGFKRVLGDISEHRLGKNKEVPISSYEPTDYKRWDPWAGFNQPDKTEFGDEDHSELMQKIYNIAESALSPKHLQVFLAKHPKVGPAKGTSASAKEFGQSKQSFLKKYNIAIRKIYEAIQDHTDDPDLTILLEGIVPEKSDEELND